MAKRAFDIPALLPQRYRDKTLDTFLRNTVEPQLSRDDTKLLYGFIGSEATRQLGDLYLTEPDLARKLIQLQAVYDVTLGVERSTLAWTDFLQRLVTLGVNPTDLGWLAAPAHNFAPPVDADKLINFGEYLWIGPWILAKPDLPYKTLGIAPVQDDLGPCINVAAIVANNPKLLPDYYLMKRGPLEQGGATMPMPDGAAWTGWSVLNLWVHKEDAYNFTIANPSVGLEMLASAQRPIIELDNRLKLSQAIDAAGLPADTGTPAVQVKVRLNQPPQFDLYTFKGEHAKFTSMLFYFEENQQSPVDTVINRRLARDASSDLTFAHGFIDPTSGNLLWAKRWQEGDGEEGGAYELCTIWSTETDVIAPSYIKLEKTGTVLNLNKFNSWRNYYWTGTALTSAELPAWNPIGDAEYVVIEQGGTSGWAEHNYWRHVSELEASKLHMYHHATKPIIEFNVELEVELVTTKTSFNQLPKFKLYEFDDVSNEYKQVPFADDYTANDAFTTGSVLARLADLTPAQQLSITETPDVAQALSFTMHNELFVCSLASLKYVPTSGATEFGFSTRVLQAPTFAGAGTAVASIGYNAVPIPQVYTLEALSPTMFSVVSTLPGTNTILTIDQQPIVLADGVMITISGGTVPFNVGDKFFIEVKSVLTEPINYCIKLGSDYRTFEIASDIINKDLITTKQVAADPTIGDGAWEVPKQLSLNLDNETQVLIKEGDLITHLASVLQAQPDFVGSSIGANNSRNLTLNMSLGGIIKQFEGRFQLLLGLLAQRSFSARDLLEFSSRSYDQLLNAMREFVEIELIGSTDSALFVGGLTSIDEQLLAKAIEYVEKKATSSLEADRPFSLSTMPVKALGLTLPYLGLAQAVEPREELDLELNLVGLVHHDGHRSPLAQIDLIVLKNMVQRRVLRSNGQLLPGYVGGSIPPAKPFAQQLWLDLSSSTLFLYDTVSDTGELPADAPNGQHSYDRMTGETWQKSGEWISLGSGQQAQESPWRPVDLSRTLQLLLLKLEQKLYRECPNLGIRLTSTAPAYTASMQLEYEQFATRQGVDPYLVNYDAQNPFTWSYKTSTTPASWQQLYLQVYGTSRPDQQPWLSAGYASHAALVAAAIAVGVLPNGSTSFAWTSTTQAFIKSRQQVLGKPTALSVDATGNLLPPFAFGAAEQLLASAPPTPTRPFIFGEGGPIELVWRRSTAFATAHQVSLFRADPLSFVSTLWGESLVKVNNYVLLDKTSLKPGISCQLHGELEVARVFAPEVETLSIISLTRTYVFEVASVQAKLYKVVIDDIFSTFISTTDVYDDGIISFFVPEPTRGFNLGDRFIVDILPDGSATVTTAPTGYKLLEGYGQLFSQLVRSKLADETIDSSSTLLRGWKTSLAYNTGKIIDSSLAVELDRAQLSNAAYQLLLKETYLASAAWYSALKVTLVRVGSTDRRANTLVPAKRTDGQRGDDWVFKVEGYVPGRARIEWYAPGANRQTFFALNAKRSSDEWTHADKGVLTSTHGPVVITGIQATIDFIFGVAARYEELGFVVEGQAELPRDPSTNRPRDWQLLIEQFVDQQFGGVEANTAFLFDPLSAKLLFAPKAGLATEIKPVRSTTSVFSCLFDRSGKPITNSKVFRTPELTTVVPPEAIFAAKLTTSKFEHTLVLADQIGSTLFYSAFLGQQIDRLFLSGRYTFDNWMPTSGSRFLTNGSFKPNMEAAVNNLSMLYDSSKEVLDDATRARARALLGYRSKAYYNSRGASELTQFRFWQAAIKAKGTNRAIDAFVNAKQYKTAGLDEFWAYKVAEYGDARLTTNVELKLKPDDSTAERTNLLLLEADELELITSFKENGKYDIPKYDITPYDVHSLYTSDQTLLMEYFDPSGYTVIKPNDETRWFRYDELGALQYLEADVIAQVVLTPESINRCYTVRDPFTGLPVRADCFEVIDAMAIQGSELYDMLAFDISPYEEEVGTIYRETGELIAGTTTEYSTPKFRRLNHSTIKFDDPIFIDRKLIIRCYGPAIKKFSPSTLLTYSSAGDQLITDELVWWDPGRGSHHPQAHAIVDLQQAADPAVYNQSIVASRNSDSSRIWGKNQVGKIWWDTSLAEWLPYSDTKIRPEYTQRRAAWGGMKDFAEMSLYEWVESSVPPTEYDNLVSDKQATGEVGFIDKAFRVRKWEVRPIAWLYSANPQADAWAPLKLGNTQLNMTNEYLYSLDGMMPTFKLGERLSTAKFSSPTKELSTLTGIDGLCEVVNTVELIVGSVALPTTPVFVAVAAVNNKVDVSSFKPSNALPKRLLLTAEVSNGTPYLRATLADEQTQAITLADTPPTANTMVELNFDQLGIIITTTVTASRAAGSATSRVSAVFAELAQADIVIRQAYKITTLQALPATTLYSLTDAASPDSWLSWLMPVAYDITSDNEQPFNKWKPLLGTWSNVTELLPLVINEIQAQYDFPLDVQPYRSAWSVWKKAKPLLLRTVYSIYEQTHAQSLEALQFPALEPQAKLARVYINGILYKGSKVLTRLDNSFYDVTSYDFGPYSASTIVPIWFYDIDPAALQPGDEVVVIVPPIEPTSEQLKLKLETKDADPTISVEWSFDIPHVTVQGRSITGELGATTYYFWVKQKLTPAKGNIMSIARAAELLRAHDSFFAVPQMLKFYNQLDARPNRYAMLSLCGLAWSVTVDKRYKLRIKRTPSMRNDDENLSLRALHAEWKLIRTNQPTKIPFELWRALVDTLCGESQSGQELPALVYSDYDARSANIPASWGFDMPRAMCPPGVARTTLKNTLLSPATAKYDKALAKMVVNPITFEGFNIDDIDKYFISTTEIRKFMGLIWKNATPKQINELFFAVLHDSLAYTSELPGIFKTSFVALDDIRTTSQSQLAAFL